MYGEIGKSGLVEVLHKAGLIMVRFESDLFSFKFTFGRFPRSRKEGSLASAVSGFLYAALPVLLDRLIKQDSAGQRAESGAGFDEAPAYPPVGEAVDDAVLSAKLNTVEDILGEVLKIAVRVDKGSEEEFDEAVLSYLRAVAADLAQELATLEQGWSPPYSSGDVRGPRGPRGPGIL